MPHLAEANGRFEALLYKGVMFQSPLDIKIECLGPTWGEEKCLKTYA